MHLLFPSLLVLALRLAGCQNTSPRHQLKRLCPPNPFPDVSLRETRWVPRQLAGKLISPSISTSKPFPLLRTDGAAEGNGSCNRFRGKFFTDTPSELKFSPLISTRMACPAMAIKLISISPWPKRLISASPVASCCGWMPPVRH